MRPPKPELLADYREYLRGLAKYSLATTVTDRTPDRERDLRQSDLVSNHTGRMQSFKWWLRDQKRFREASMEESWEGAFEDFDRRHGHVPTFRWTDGEYRYAAQILTDDDGQHDFEGSFTDKTPAWASYVPWMIQKTCPVHGKSLRMGMQAKCDIGECELTLTHSMRPIYPRGPDHRHYWMEGGYHRNEGKSNGREFDYGVVAHYNYFELRSYYWLDGHSKAEADALAREAFKSRKERLERYGSGDLGWVGVITYLLPLEEDPDKYDSEMVLASDAIWGIESDYDLSYIMERALDCGSQAKHDYESSSRLLKQSTASAVT